MKVAEPNSQAKPPQELALYKARLSLLVQQTPAGVWAGVASGFLFVYLAWSVADTNILLLWLFFFTAGGVMHLFFLRYVNNILVEEKATLSLSRLIRLERLMSLSFFCGGLLFGCIGLIMEPDWPVTMLVVVPLLTAGAVAGALSSNQGSFSGYLSFITPLTFMVAFGFFRIEMPMLGAFVLIFYIVMVVTGKLTHKALIDSFRLRVTNLALIEDLTQNNKTQNELLEQLRKSEQLAGGAFDGSAVAMALVDRDATIFKVNQAGCDLFQFSETGLLGKQFIAASQEKDQTQELQLFKELVEGDRNQIDI